MTQLWIGTRKGLFSLMSNGETWDVRAVAFLGVPVSMVLHDKRDGSLYAALAHGHFGVKLHRSDNNGKDWREIAVPSFPGGEQAPVLHLIWSLAEGGRDEKGTLWAGTIPAALFYSTDRGESWQLNEALWNRPERPHWFGGGFDEAGLHSILVDPRDSKHVMIAISCGGVWSSRDRGANWESKSKGLWAAYMPEGRRDDPNIQDPHRMIRCHTQPDHLWIQHHNGIFRSTNNAEQWQEVSKAFGFAVAVHPANPEQAWFVPAQADACRVPLNGDFCVNRTDDGGRTFISQKQGLPQGLAYDLVYRHALDIDSGGDYLAMGSTTGHLWVSADAGQSWTMPAANLPPIACLHWR